MGKMRWETSKKREKKVDEENSVKSLGRLLLVEMYGVDPKLLNDHELIERALEEAARNAETTIVGKFTHKFNPIGVSSILIIAESHIAVHTWPEHGYAAVDIFTCGEKTNPWKVYEYLVSVFKPKSVNVFETKRGVIVNPGGLNGDCVSRGANLPGVGHKKLCDTG